MNDIKQRAIELQKQIVGATRQERIELQPTIERVIQTLTMKGHSVPLCLVRVNREINDEFLDDMFDNMPV
jgi:hypothetical protein